jgi:hypothetical protein
MSGYGSDPSGRVIRELSRDLGVIPPLRELSRQMGLVPPRRAPSATSP